MLSHSGQACLQRLWPMSTSGASSAMWGLVTCPSSWCCTSRRSCPSQHCCPSWGEESRNKEKRIWGVWWWYGLWSFWLNFYNTFSNKKLSYLLKKKRKRKAKRPELVSLPNVKKLRRGVPVVAQWLMNPTRNCEVAGWIPGLAQWVNSLALPWAVV